MPTSTRALLSKQDLFESRAPAEFGPETESQHKTKEKSERYKK
jgi:hypothetical protein